MNNRSIPLSCIYTITIILAACSIIYELLIAQTISSIAFNSVVWYALVIGFYLAAMGVGAIRSEKYLKNDNVVADLFNVEVKLMFLGAFAVPALYLSHVIWMYFYDSPTLFFDNEIVAVCAFSVILTIGYLTGLELPLLMRVANLIRPSTGQLNRVLALDYLGSLIGSVVFALVLFRYFDLLTIGFLTAFLNFCISLFLLFVLKANGAKVAAKGFVSIVLLAGIALAAFKLSALEQFFLKKYYYHQFMRSPVDIIKPFDSLPDVDRYSSVNQKIDVVKIPANKNSITPILRRAYSDKHTRSLFTENNYRLFLNGDFQYGLMYEEIYHEYFAHIPVILHKRVPREILVLGAGDGLLLRELLKYKEVEKITLVDLDARMIELTRTHPVLSKNTNQSLDDPRVEVVIADAYHYIHHNQKHFDAIYADFPEANHFDLSKLYSQEFYYFVKRSLKEEGFAAIGAPGIARFLYNAQSPQNLRPDNAWPVYYNTLKSIGFDHVVPFLTTLEQDNPDLIEDLTHSNLIGHLTNEQAREIVKKYTFDLQEGFIYMRADGKNPDLNYKEFGIDLDVLNAKRFALAFKQRYIHSEKMKPELINSIMRPKLPMSDARLSIKKP